MIFIFVFAHVAAIQLALCMFVFYLSDGAWYWGSDNEDGSRDGGGCLVLLAATFTSLSSQSGNYSWGDKVILPLLLQPLLLLSNCRSHSALGLDKSDWLPSSASYLPLQSLQRPISAGTPVEPNGGLKERMESLMANGIPGFGPRLF